MCDDVDYAAEVRMTVNEERLKVAANCAACMAVYAAWKTSDGTISLIGMGEECTCGSTEFRVVDG